MYNLPPTDVPEDNCTALLRVIHQLSATANYTTDILALLELALRNLMNTLQVPKGVIRLNEYVRCKGLPFSVYTLMNDLIKVGHEDFSFYIRVDDWQIHEGLFGNLKPAMEKLSLRASLITPIITGNTCEGYIWLSDIQPKNWTDAQLELMQTSGHIICLGAHKINTLKKNRYQAKYIHKLNISSKSLKQIYDFDEALNIVGSNAVNLLEANQAAIFLRKPDNTIQSPWQYALSKARINQLLDEEASDIDHYLMTSLSPILIDMDETPSPLPSDLKTYLDSEGVRTINLLPLVFEGNIFGLIAVCYTMPRTWSFEELDLMETYASEAAITLNNAWMYEQIEHSYREMALELAHAMEARDDSLTEHNMRITRMARNIAKQLGCSNQEIDDIYWAAMLHDIGMTSIPDEILKKSGPLTDKEWENVQQQPIRGEELTQSIFTFQNASAIIRNFRERYDGKGYPDQLKGKSIPLGARILAVADAYDSMVNERPYKKPISKDEAIQEISNCKGKQFDPVIVDAFLSVIQTPTIKNTLE